MNVHNEDAQKRWDENTHLAMFTPQSGIVDVSNGVVKTYNRATVVWWSIGAGLVGLVIGLLC